MSAAPIRMVLHCPRCQLQHIDAPDPHAATCAVYRPDEPPCDCGAWLNPPHRSHLCDACQTIWRPADVATTGVASIETRGLADTWPPL